MSTIAAFDLPAAPSPTRAAVAKPERKLEAKLRRQVGKAIADYGMIDDGDRVMVCVSGGKDSYTLLDMLLALQRRAPVKFDLVAVNLDQKQPGFPEEVLPQYLEALGVDYRIVEETLFLNMFYGAALKAMPPKLLSDDGRHVVVRPLVYCREADIQRYAEAREFPIIPCNLCGSQENLRRKQIKAMLAAWEIEDPGRTERLFRSLCNVTLSHLADPERYDFRSLASITN